MSKHIDLTTKIKLIIDFQNSNLSMTEYLNKIEFYKLCNSKKSSNSKCQGYITFYQWFQRYKALGIAGFSRKYKQIMIECKKNKKQPTLEEREKALEDLLKKLTPDELIDIIKIIHRNLAALNDNDRVVKMIIVRNIYKSYSTKLKLKTLLWLFDLKESTYHSYFARHKDIDLRYRQDKKDLVEKIVSIYTESKKVYGYRGIAAVLRNSGYIIGDNTVRNYCRELEIKSLIRQKCRKPAEPKNTKFKCQDLLQRQFTQTEDRVICTDITYIQFNGKWIYLCSAINLLNNEISGWKLSETQDAQIVIDTLNQINLKNVIIHSDHGSQFSSKEVVDLISSKGWIQSMSRVGNSLDNRPIEYWFSIFKTEFLYLQNYDNLSFKEFKKLVSNFITWYNKFRIQGSLKNHSPIEYRQMIL